MPDKVYRCFMMRYFRKYSNRHAGKEYDNALNKEKSTEPIILKIVKKLWTSDSSNGDINH